MLYAGHNIGEDYLYELSEVLKGKQFGIIKYIQVWYDYRAGFGLPYLEETIGRRCW